MYSVLNLNTLSLSASSPIFRNNYLTPANQFIMKKLILALLPILFILYFSSCKKDPVATGIDKQLFDMAGETEGFSWYKNSDAYLPKSSGSGHPQALLRTRFNEVAASMLDENGQVKPDITFPEGSLIVKELHDSESSLARYAILYKNTGNSSADNLGWVWGYINADGTVSISASKKGSSCISCHLQEGNIDYTLMNKFFP
jgi:hypothetical protein